MDGKNKKPTTEELEAELAREKANSAYLKNLLDRTLEEKMHFQRVLAGREEDEKEREQKEEKNKKELDDLRIELEIQKYAKRFIVMGMGEKRAEETARAMLERNEDVFHENIKLLIKKVKHDAQERTIQKFLESRSEIHAGNGEPDTEKPLSPYEKIRTVDSEMLKKFM